jgi:uncharacterized protein YggT (Ycf19 family)
VWRWESEDGTSVAGCSEPYVSFFRDGMHPFAGSVFRYKILVLLLLHMCVEYVHMFGFHGALATSQFALLN